MLERLADGFGEERKALAVVKEAIRIVALEVALVIYEQVGDAIVYQAFKTAVLVSPAQGHIKIGDMFHLVKEGVVDRGVLGHHDDNFCASSLQSVGE